MCVWCGGNEVGASLSTGEEGKCMCGGEGGTLSTGEEGGVCVWCGGNEVGASLSTGEEGVCMCGGEGMRWGAHCQLVRRVCVCVVGRE